MSGHVHKPTKASEIETVDTRTPEDKARAVARKALDKRLAKRETLQRTGHAPPSSTDLHARLEYQRRKLDERSAKRFKARKLAEQKVTEKVEEKNR